jgi:hypothetical protein
MVANFKISMSAKNFNYENKYYDHVVSMPNVVINLMWVL